MLRVSLAEYAPFSPTNETKQQKKLNYQFQPQNNSCNNLLLNQVSEHTRQHPNTCAHTESNSQPLQVSFCASFLTKLTSGTISFIFPHLHQRFSVSVVITGLCTFLLPLVPSSKPILSFPLHCRRRTRDFRQRKTTNFITTHLIPLLFPPHPLAQNLAGAVMLQVSTEGCLPSSLPERCMELTDTTGRTKCIPYIKGTL